MSEPAREPLPRLPLHQRLIEAAWSDMSGDRADELRMLANRVESEVSR